MSEFNNEIALLREFTNPVKDGQHDKMLKQASSIIQDLRNKNSPNDAVSNDSIMNKIQKTINLIAAGPSVQMAMKSH